VGGVQMEEFERRVLVDYLVELINIGRHLESLKMEMARMKDFNLMDAFMVFDEMGKGHCTMEKFRQVLIDLGITRDNCTMRHVHLFFRRYNISDDGQLKFSEFIEAIACVSENFRELLKDRRAKCRYGEIKPLMTIFDSQTYTNFILLLEGLLRAEQETERIKRMLQGRKGFSPT
jgi:hypothetical protein